MTPLPVGETAFPTLTITIETHKETRAAILAAFNAADAGARVAARHVLAFDSYADLHCTLTPSRMAAMAALAGRGAMTAEAVASRLGRPVEAVEADLTALSLAGVIDRSEGGFVFPYERARIEADL